MNVALLGMGRLGRSLAQLLPAAGWSVRPWRRGETLPAADIYWLTVRDEAIGEVAASLPTGAIALHASGSAGPEVLGGRVVGGVCHPLMTFPGPEVGLPSLTGAGMCVAGPPAARDAAIAIARSLGMEPFEVTGDRRLYHASACLVSGHLAAGFLDAVSVLVAAGVDPDRAPRLLYPLAAESLRRAAEFGATAITGPAARGDVATIEGHREALDPAVRAVYDALGEAITRRLR